MTKAELTDAVTRRAKAFDADIVAIGGAERFRDTCAGKILPGLKSVICIAFRVLHTPGHTPGSVCFQIGTLLFTGDTLFAGSCGRTDLPGGSWETITQSLAFLRSLNAPYQVFPGHGEATTLEREKAVNPYLRG